jgi:hypothetical protein
MVSVRLGRKRRAHQTGLAERRLGLIFFAPHGSSWHIATNSKCAASVNFTSGLGAILRQLFANAAITASRVGS